MDENNIAEVETEETELSEQIDSAFDEEWGDASADDDDFDLSDEPEAEEAEDQREGSDEPEETEAEAEETEQTEESEAKEDAADQRFHLKHNDEEMDVDTAKVVELAQKGLDYDRVRQERDSFKDQHPTFKAYESFLQELAEASGTDIEGLMESTRATLLVQKARAEGKELSEAAAIAQIRAEGRKAKEAPAEPDKPEKTPEQEQEEQKRQDIARFVAAYPDVKAEDIPQEVWRESFRTGDLTAAYARWENKKLKAENEQLKQNQKNKERSTGSRRSAGATSPKDAFDEGWDSI